MVSPSSTAIFLRLSKLMVFLSSNANSWKALSISSSDYFSFILAVIICRNSVQSMELELSFSFCSLFISEINFLISSFFGSKPKALNATLSYLMSITPEPSASNRSKASLMSFFCFSVSSCRKVSFDFIFFAVFFSFSLFITVIYLMQLLTPYPTHVQINNKQSLSMNSTSMLQVHLSENGLQQQCQGINRRTAQQTQSKRRANRPSM